jgi:hypothetical protein
LPRSGSSPSRCGSRCMSSPRRCTPRSPEAARGGPSRRHPRSEWGDPGAPRRREPVNRERSGTAAGRESGTHRSPCGRW